MTPFATASDAKRGHVNDWFHTTLLSRLNDQKNGAIIIVMQRLYVDDLCGHLLKTSNEWTVLNLPAIAEQDEEIQIGENLYYHRKFGEALHPERDSEAD